MNKSMASNIYQEIMIGGIPIDNLSLSQCTNKIIDLAEKAKRSKSNYYVATVNVDFLVNALSWHKNDLPRHPELIDILRRADIATADGMPIVWLSKLLDSPIRSRVAGSDLLPALAKEAEQKDLTLFLLGGQGDSAEKAALTLNKQYPNLKVADTYSPRVYSEGELMLSSEEDDKVIIEKINQSGANLLFIGFGNPKQELWFDRNKHLLKGVVGIGVGGSFDFITGNVKRAPVWMQKSGLEWIYRISQDPKRLWKRYAIGLIKFLSIAMPLILINKMNKGPIETRGQNSRIKFNLINSGETLEVILPENISVASLSLFEKIWSESSIFLKQVEFNFSQVNYIEPAALAKFVRINIICRKNQVIASYKSLDKPEIIELFKRSKIYDFMDSGIINSVSLEDKKDMYTITKQDNKTLILSFTGRMDASEIEKIELNNILIQLQDMNYIIDLSELIFLDSSGLRFFFKLEKHIREHNKKIIFTNISDMIMQLLTINKLENYFTLADDIEGANQFLD